MRTSRARVQFILEAAFLLGVAGVLVLSHPGWRVVIIAMVAALFICLVAERAEDRRTRRATVRGASSLPIAPAPGRAGPRRASARKPLAARARELVVAHQHAEAQTARETAEVHDREAAPSAQEEERQGEAAASVAAAREREARDEPAPTPVSAAEPRPRVALFRRLRKVAVDGAAESAPRAAASAEPLRTPQRPVLETPPARLSPVIDEPVPPGVPVRPTTPREWNLWELEGIARTRAGDDPHRDEERSLVLLHLRQFASPEGVLPVSFDDLVRETFDELLAVRDPA